jgi:type I restriction enzyme S subunit
MTGDIVFARTGATTGKSYMVSNPPDAVCASYLIRLRLQSSEILPRFVSYYFGTKAYWDAVSTGISGSAQGGFNASKLGALQIPLPPVSEQQRIVAILDEAFARLATATANAEKNFKNARELFESALNSIFTKGRWRESPLQSLCDAFDDGDWIETKDQSPSGIRLVQTGNIGEGHFKDRGEKARFISEATFKSLRCTEIFEGDCLISRLPDPVGRACLLPVSKLRMITAVDCTIVRFKKEAVVPEFFVYYSQSRAYAAAIERQTKGATRQRISRKNLGDVPLPVPALSEQKKVVEKLAGLEDEVDRLASWYERRLSQIQELEQSILQKAFSGELTSPRSQSIKEAAE